MEERKRERGGGWGIDREKPQMIDLKFEMTDGGYMPNLKIKWRFALKVHTVNI